MKLFAGCKTARENFLLAARRSREARGLGRRTARMRCGSGSEQTGGGAWQGQTRQNKDPRSHNVSFYENGFLCYNVNNFTYREY